MGWMVSILLAIFPICFGVNPIYTDFGCREGFVKLHTGCYYFAKNKSNWLDANRNCKELNSSLASIETIEENFAIKLHLHYHSEGNYYIGGVDVLHDGKFVWLSTLKTFAYNDWCLGEPNNIGSEICVHYYKRRNNCWNNAICNREAIDSGNDPMLHICEYDPFIQKKR